MTMLFCYYINALRFCPAYYNVVILWSTIIYSLQCIFIDFPECLSLFKAGWGSSSCKYICHVISMETTVGWFPVQDCFCSCWQYFNVVFFYSMHGVVPFGALNDKEYWFRVWEISSNSAGLLRVRTAARRDVASAHEAGADLWSVPVLSLGDIL